jgi:radical SAM protein with 4Fe4S-binding SPASM domain
VALETNMIDFDSSYVPVRGVFEATLGCNLQCRHCGSRAGRARPDELDSDECADLFVQLAELGTRWLTISGGEPTTREDWPELVGAASRAGIRVGMMTNGILFDDDAARIARDRGLNAVGFSVDGTTRTHDLVRGRVGHLGRLLRAVDAAKGAGLPLAVVTHVNRRNIGQLGRVHDMVVDLGAYAWQVQLGTDMGNMSDHPELLTSPRDMIDIERKLAGLIGRSPIRIEVAHSIGYFGPHENVLRRPMGEDCFNGCPAGLRTIGIESNGNVKGCLSIMAGYNEQGADFVEGNVREDRLADIWHRPGAFAYNRGFAVDDLEGSCRECPQAALCRGGCMAAKVASGGGVQNPLCVRRVLAEEEVATGHVGQTAAAVVLATMLGASPTGCAPDEDDDSGGDTESGGDTDTDTGTDEATGTDTDEATESGTGEATESGTDEATESDTATGTATETGTVTVTATATNTGGGDAYALPDCVPPGADR